jgi:hypothetical protein
MMRHLMRGAGSRVKTATVTDFHCVPILALYRDENFIDSITATTREIGSGTIADPCFEIRTSCRREPR